jgi:hypothetical protein
MLLNEFLKEHKKIEQQQATIAQLKSADGKWISSAPESIEKLDGLCD